MIEEITSTSSDDEMYNVDDILADKKDPNGVKMYLVKWRGYPDSQNSWVKSEDLKNCKLILEEYKKKKLRQKWIKKEINHPQTDEVQGVYKNENGSLIFVVKSADGKYKEVPNDIMKKEYLSVLLAYYENHIVFSDQVLVPTY